MMSLSNIEPEHTLGTAENAAYYSVHRHPGVQTAMAWLAFAHLPEELKPYARPFYEAALDLLREITTDSAELTIALNRLVESKDAAVRAGIRDKHGRPGPVPRPATVVDPPVAGNYGAGQVRPRPIQDRPQA